MDLIVGPAPIGMDHCNQPFVGSHNLFMACISSYSEQLARFENSLLARGLRFQELPRPFSRNPTAQQADTANYQD